MLKNSSKNCIMHWLVEHITVLGLVGFIFALRLYYKTAMKLF